MSIGRGGSMEFQKRAFALWRTVPTIAGFLFAFVAAVSAQSRINLAGSGSNVAGPLFVAWTDEFNKKNPAIQVRYLPLSSEEGIEQIKSSSGDFAIGEIPLSQEQMHDPKAHLVQIPVLLVAVVPVYNVPGGGELRFSGKILAQIYLGAIKNWNDPAISRLNPDVTLPDLPIEVFHRDEGRGTSYIFTDFLSRKSPGLRSSGRADLIGRCPWRSLVFHNRYHVGVPSGIWFVIGAGSRSEGILGLGSGRWPEDGAASRLYIFARQPRVQGTRKVGDGAIDKRILRRIFCETPISRYNIRNASRSPLPRLGTSFNSGLVRPEIRYAHRTAGAGMAAHLGRSHHAYFRPDRFRKDAGSISSMH